MLRRVSLIWVLCGLIVSAPVWGQDARTVAGEPANLQTTKDALIAYVSPSCKTENCYWPQIDKQTELAMRYLKASVKAAGDASKLAVVLDIDETSLSNWAVEQHDDFGYIPSDSNMCVALWCGRAIPGTLRLFKEAKRLGVKVFFITGRPTSQQKDTEANLQAEGFVGYDGITLRPPHPDSEKSVVPFKSGARVEIAKSYTIVLNMGDQLSDLDGPGQAEHSVKLPNPFYYIQ